MTQTIDEGNRSSLAATLTQRLTQEVTFPTFMKSFAYMIDAGTPWFDRWPDRSREPSLQKGSYAICAPSSEGTPLVGFIDHHDEWQPEAHELFDVAFEVLNPADVIQLEPLIGGARRQLDTAFAFRLAQLLSLPEIVRTTPRLMFGRGGTLTKEYVDGGMWTVSGHIRCFLAAKLDV